MASSREIQINDLPPEFSAQENDSDDDGNWTHALESWADHQLSQGNRSILDQAHSAV